MPESFEVIEVASHGRSALLHVRGQLDAKSAPELLRRCTELRASGKSVVLNLKAVSFIASSGIGALLGLAEEFRKAEEDVRFTDLSPAVDTVIQLLNLRQFLHIDASDGEALAALER